jgi:TIR domain
MLQYLKALFSGRRKASRIFINYRRDDAGGVAGRLADSLGAYFGDGRVFRDIGGIEGGANFEEVLRQTAQSADAMIVLIGRHWVSAVNKSGQRRLDDPEDWVAREIAAALERKIPIFPVLIEDAVMPRAEELPDLIKPLSRHNAIAITDSRWASDVTRLAKVVAIDLPGSEAQRQLEYLQRVISIALLAAITFTTSILAVNVAAHAPKIVGAANAIDKNATHWPLELWQSGVTFVVIVGSVMLLFMYAHLVDAAKKRFFYISGFAGVLGTLFCFVKLIELPNELETIYMFLGSTVTATAVLALMNFSGFKAR